MNTTDFLYQQWQHLIPLSTSTSYFKDIIARHNTKSRYYHNINHLQHIFQTILPFEAQLEHAAAVYWAIFYHDIIYNTLRKDNEQKSAIYAQKMLQQLDINDTLIPLVKDLIIATQHHLPLQPTNDFHYFIDADLAILGSQPPIYQHYCEAIRKEYYLVPHFLYRKGRKKALESILKRTHIYHTHDLRQQLEKQARQNIEAELRQL